jgi:hypothetical protein
MVQSGLFSYTSRKNRFVTRPRVRLLPEKNNYHPTTLRDIMLLEIASWNDVEIRHARKSNGISLNRGICELTLPQSNDD